jgi:beta-lactamase class A
MILADITSESTEYLSLKGRLLQTISDFERKGTITGASLYLKRLSDGSWMNINGNETYLPGSLIKVAIMLYYLKQEELHPGTLEQEFYCKKPVREFPRQEFDEPTIEPGRNYRVSELIRSMIVSSDNLATNILSQHLDGSAFHKMFTDLGIPPDDINDLEYVISPKEYSKFLRVLYNASYVSEKLSEYGLTLMTQSKFREGMAKQLPAGLVIARKFGERGVNNNMDFSEAGIVYDHNDPYILTIMTRGSNMKEQAEVISQLSIEVYRSLSKE